jgi:putative membrane-bound dehydrogenase-like protein
MLAPMMNAIKFTCCWLGTVCALLPAKELDGVRAPAAGPCPTVEEAIKKMTVPEGYEVRNFASEPMIINPVAMTWDHRGRLWVVELYEYPLGAKEQNDYQKTATDEDWRPVVKSGNGNGRDRVIILEDTDNDGKADKRTVFLEGLSLATAILCGYDGVFIGQAPNMFFFRDTNGDDKADEYKTVLTGFGLEDRHELLNSFTWGPDGWMYFTHGVFTNSKVRRPTVPKEQGNKLDAGIYRVKFENESLPSVKSLKSLPEGTKGTEETKGAAAAGPTAVFHEVFADGTSNPWGCDYDAAGNWFVEACVIDHLFHMAPGGIYQRQGGAPENPYAYELLPSIVQKDQPKHFRAAYAGIQVYQGGRYPKDTDGHLFFGNIHDNAIHEEAVEPVGATFKAKPIRDFLRANDGWFRPVSIQTGPDGFLWVMDWCDKYPCYQNAQANPEGVDREKGRIWRVVYNPRRGASRPPIMKKVIKIFLTRGARRPPSLVLGWRRTWI